MNSFLCLGGHVMKLFGHLFKLFGDAHEVIHRHRKQNAAQDKCNRNGEIKNCLRKYKCCFHARILHYFDRKQKSAAAKCYTFYMNKPLVNMAIKTLLIFVFLFNLAAGLYMPIIAIYITEHVIGATLTVLGISIAIYSIVKSIFQIPIAKRLDAKKGERDDFYVLLTGILLAILYSLGFLIIKNVSHLYMLQVLTGISDACIMASFFAIFSHHIDKDSQGFEWSLFSVGGQTLSAAVGGILGGYMSFHYGFSSVFILAASFNIIAALILILLFPYVKNFRLAEDYKQLKIGRQ